MVQQKHHLGYFSIDIKKDEKLIKTVGQVPIGNPFKGTKILMDNNKQLLINGDMISKGYFQNNKENKLKFIFKNKKRYYCTGDIVKKNSKLFFLCRKK